MERFVLEKNLERFDFYIEKADNKSSFILALSSALLAGVLLEINSVSLCVESLLIFKLSVLGSVISLIISIYYSLKTLIPRGNGKNNESCFYFESVSCMDKSEYENKISSLDSEEKLRDALLFETKQLAQICKTKMKNFNMSLTSLAFGVGFIVIITLVKML